MDFELITGFNIYEGSEPFSDISIVLSHLHTNLDVGDPYRDELEATIKRCSVPYTLKKVHYERIDRYTSYRLRKGWAAEEYYDVEGNRITENDARAMLSSGESIIGGGIQSEVKIALSERKHLIGLLNEFTARFNAFEISEDGLAVQKDGRPKINYLAVPGSWEVPVFVVRSIDDPKLGETFPHVTEFRIPEIDFFINILIDEKKEYFERVISKSSISIISKAVNVNRLFAEYLNETKNSERYNEFLDKI